jgi:hypothetical protein
MIYSLAVMWEIRSGEGAMQIGSELGGGGGWHRPSAPPYFAADGGEKRSDFSDPLSTGTAAVMQGWHRTLA